ncbi:NAD(P)/FAD-dependent oxidoreductase [Flexivirga sp. ID2601S]|uniref:NAD(P)/FAD-dependent oxidoreductase n=1 Tax=Flexivirga aerilata TaxID=1656889 RepID=A0A849AQJ0_9MICO|nr:NAD(P)/FAD-dependent oxidoreductase [Flexivirga aerilata]NNG40560.1 NAD(P)/FAD-dependent oxidoreductase [Flexivirga aerilata]
MRVLVVGGGPAGLTAALHAAELGAEVTLVERHQVGGTALSRGPAPVRALARAARLARDWESWPAFGLTGPRPEIDVGAALANADRVARYAYEGKRLADHLRAGAVSLAENTGDLRFVGTHTIAADDGRTWSADRIILAIGGRPGRLDVPGAELAITYEDARAITRIPTSACIVGTSDTGCQLASILHGFGCQDTLIGAAPRLLPRADHAISVGLASAFTARGMTVVTGASVDQLDARPGGMQVCLSLRDGTPRVVDVQRTITAVGWPGNADLVDAAAAGVVTDRGYVVVDEHLQSSAPHIFACGDVDGNSMLVSSAVHEGRVAAENAVLGPTRGVTHEVVPVGSFTDPEYGMVGLTEEQARQRYPCEVAVARYDDLLRPIADGRPNGFCKLIIDTQERRIVGAHVLGEYSAEVIQVAATSMAAGMRIEAVAEMEFAFPTFAEGISQAAQMLVRRLGKRPMPVTWSRRAASGTV